MSETNTEAPQKPPREGHLKLRAETEEDITVLSAVLQDAVTLMADMTYLPKERRFALMVNRYLWEAEKVDAGLDGCLRVRTGVHFDGVLKVTTLNMPPRSSTKVLELLAVDAAPWENGAGAEIVLVFAGGSIIRLEAECIDAYLSDVGEPWPARCRPRHAVDNL
jgi:hypothetical protein